MSNGKVTLIGGGGVRTPLVIFGVNESSKHLGIDEMVLYDIDGERAKVMSALGNALIAREGGTLKLRVATRLEDAVAGAAFVLTAIRVDSPTARSIAAPNAPSKAPVTAAHVSAAPAQSTADRSPNTVRPTEHSFAPALYPSSIGYSAADDPLGSAAPTSHS